MFQLYNNIILPTLDETSELNQHNIIGISLLNKYLN